MLTQGWEKLRMECKEEEAKIVGEQEENQVIVALWDQIDLVPMVGHLYRQFLVKMLEE